MSMIRGISCGLLAALAIALSACAAATPGYEPPTKVNQHRLKQTSNPEGTMGADGSYTLSEEELKFDCKRLTGSTQIKILQLRHYSSRPTPSTASKWMGGISDTFGRGADTIMGKSSPPPVASDYARERAHLETLNATLKSKGCPTFDLDAELRPEKGSEMPTPIRKK
jgi:hypothetical protein